jgi:uncharacterized protein YkwD
MFSSQFRGSRGQVSNAVAALLAAACLFTSARADSELEPCADNAALQRAVQRLNEVRQQGEAPCAGTKVAMRTLAWDARLAGSAQEQATDLAQRDLLSHTDARQRSFGTRLRSAGYAAAGAGENLAAGQPDFDDTLQAWLASPSHCANLMQPEFRDVGVACVQRPGSRYERFWVAHLGTPVRSTVTASAAPLNGALFAAR